VLAGVDLSGGMLRVARSRDASVHWIQGRAERLPIASASFHYATNQFSYPHIADKRSFLAEVFRVLRPGGRFVLTNIDPWSMTGWALYRYFPESLALDERDFLPVARLSALVAGVGFADVSATAAERPQSQDPQALLASASARHSASQLMAISDAAYEAGLQRIREDISRGVRAVESPFVVVTVQADKPG
jgi:SAM-dependent methyltransferase